MTSNLLYVPLRRTQSAQLGRGLRICIEKECHQNPDKYSEDLAIIDRLRDKTIEIPATKAALDDLSLYYAQISNLIPKFPNDVKTDFIWYSTLGYATNATVRNSTLKFEQINVLYNIGALNSHLGILQSRTDDSGLKAAYQYFQVAAGCFGFLAKSLLPEVLNDLPLGLDHDTIDALLYLCLAQAQECFWQKAVSDGAKNMTIARLSQQVSKDYSEALTRATRSSSIRSEWIHHFTCKKHHFSAAAQYRASIDCLDRAKYGEEVARLREALNECNNALMSSKYVLDSVLEDLQGLSDKLKSDLTRAEHDNDLIYLQDVPLSSNLAPISQAPMARQLIPPGVSDPINYIKSLGVEPLFQNILLYVVYQATNVYMEKLESYIHSNIIVNLEGMTVLLHHALQELNLPGAVDSIARPEGVPQLLLSHSDDLRAKGGIAQVRGSLNDVKKLYLESQHLLEEGLEMLQLEEHEDSLIRSRQGTERWNRPTSRISGQELWHQSSVLSGYLHDASESDEIVRKKFLEVEHILEILASGKVSDLEENVILIRTNIRNHCLSIFLNLVLLL